MIEIGQTWKSKYEYPSVGYYTVKVLEILDKDTVRIKFTATEWDDGHWTYGEQSIINLLRNYDLVKNE